MQRVSYISKRRFRNLESTLKFQRGDIYFVRLDNRTGSEQSGTRPAVILQNDVGNSCSPTLIVATLTSKTEKKATQPTHCLVEPEGLEPSIVQAEQIFTIDKSRVKRFVGHLTPEEMRRVDDAVKISLALNPMGSIQKLKPIIRSTAAYAPPEVVDGKPPVYPYTPIKSDFEDAGTIETSVYKGYKRDKIEMRGDRAEISDFPLYLNTVAGGLDCRDQTIGGFSFVVKIYAVPVVEIIG